MPLKGQTLSPEAIEQMKESKKKRLWSKYKWELIEPYLDVEIDIGSRNRDKNFITLREFKQLIEEGNNIKEISQITSKHLAAFYSKFTQGAINLSKDDFIKEYESGLSLVEIAEKHKISKDSITFLRQLYEQKNKGAKFIHRKQTETPLTQKQKEVLYGSMMGDAKKGSMSSVSFKHGGSQKDYLLWKYQIFENVASEHSLRCENYIDKRSEYKGSTWRFYTHANTDIEECMMEFYQSGKKQITRSILDKLTPLSIAVWFQDDGVTDFGHRAKIRTGGNHTPVCKFCTESFSKESCEIIQTWLEESYGINAELLEIQLSNGVGYRVKICYKDIDKFINLIKPYILPMFQYKIDYQSYIQRRKNRQEKPIMGKIFNCPLGADFSNLPLKEQDQYISNLIVYYQRKGIASIVNRPDDWENHMLSVIKANPDNLIKDDHIAFSNIGNRFLMSHFPNFWEARSKGNKSPKEVFENEKYLAEILRSIINRGVFPNEDEVLKSLQRYRGNKRLSGFMPHVAKAIYHKYCDDGSRVFDFCAGYGGRLFGALSCEKVNSYTGIEVNFKTYQGLHDLYHTLRVHGDIKKEVNLFNQDSILGMEQFSDKSFDFCFTSPPYFDAEEYSEEDNQSCLRYLSYSDWFVDYLIGSMQEAIRISKRVAINVANTGGYKIADDLRKWLGDNDIQFREDRLRLPQYGGGERFEPVFVI